MTLLLNIDVPDVEAGVRFYTAAFGLKVGRRFSADFVELLGWPAPVYLLTKAAGTVGAGGDLRRYAQALDARSIPTSSSKTWTPPSSGPWLRARSSRLRPRTRPTDGSPCWATRSATASACSSSTQKGYDALLA